MTDPANAPAPTTDEASSRVMCKVMPTDPPTTCAKCGGMMRQLEGTPTSQCVDCRGFVAKKARDGGGITQP